MKKIIYLFLFLVISQNSNKIYSQNIYPIIDSITNVHIIGSKIELTSPGSYNIKILTEDSLVTYFDLDTTFENNYNIIYLFINRDIVIQNADTLNPYYKINIPISKFYFIDITKRIKFLTL